MSNTFETAVTPEQAAELVRQISLLAETFEKKKRAIIRGIEYNTSSYDELKTIEYAIENVTNISNRARNLIRKQNNRDKALQDNRENASTIDYTSRFARPRSSVPLPNRRCNYFQEIVSRSGTETSCGANMDMSFCSTNCPYATNMPMSRKTVVNRRKCG